MEFPDKTAGPTPPKKDIKPVVSGAKQVPRPATRRFLDFLFAESPKTLVKTVGANIIVPRFKAGIEAALNEFIAGAMWGGSVNRPMTGGMVPGAVLRGGGINYAAASTGQPSGLAQARQANVARTSGNYQDLTLPSQDFAEILLGNMYELLNQYRVVAVADLYELAGMTPAPSDNAYGWTTLDGSRISHVRDGYLLELPRPSLIN